MEIVVKHHVQKTKESEYSYPLTEDIIQEIPQRSVEFITDFDDVAKFRFFDSKDFLDEGTFIRGENFNYSGWIHTGKRVSIDACDKTYFESEKIDKMKEMGINFVSVHPSFKVVFPMRVGDITFEEYLSFINEEQASKKEDLIEKMDELSKRLKQIKEEIELSMTNGVNNPSLNLGKVEGIGLSIEVIEESQRELLSGEEQKEESKIVVNSL